MKTLIIYYSYTGRTKAFAQKKAQELEADVYEVTEKKNRSKFNAYLFGSFAAMKQKGSDINPISIDMENFDKIVIATPIWAGFPVPAINSVISLLPSGKDIEIYSVSASGKSSGEEKVTTLVLKKDCIVTGYYDIKGE